MYSGCVCEGVLDETDIGIDRLKKRVCPLYSSRPHPTTEGLDRTKRLALPSTGGFLLPGCEQGRESFPAFRTELKHRLILLGFGTDDFGTRTYTIGFAGSQAVRLKLELHHQQSWVSSLLAVELSISRALLSCKPTPTGSVSLDDTD